MSESSSTKPHEGDGLLRLAGALASNNQHNENSDIVKWLETASVDDLRLAFPVLLNWIRNASKKAAKAGKSLAATVESDAADDPRPIALAQSISADQVAQKIVGVLEEAIEYKIGAEHAPAVSSLRMALAGYLHTNHRKMRKYPVVANLEKRTKEKIALDRAATNTLNMVNLACPDPMSVSKYIPPEEEVENPWGIPHIHIDLGLGLQQTSPADVCQEFVKDKKELLHPFSGEKVGRMHVKKVIPSKRKPVWIEYYDKDERPLKPDVLAKQGDDLRNDFSVSVVSKLCESVWAKAPIEWTLGTPPTVCAYNVLVTAEDAGYLEMVPGKNFLDLSEAKEDDSWESVDIRKFAPSLIGAYIVNFILGVRDRHEDNMMVVGDLLKDPKMMQIDFGYVLMEFPGGVHFDMPRLTMPIPLVDRFQAEPGRTEETTLMDDLQHDMLAAYLVLRRHSQQLVPFCAHLMSSSYDYKHVETVLTGRHCFRTHKSEHKVIKWMSEKLVNQWAHFFFRREIKLGMVRGYYKFVELTSFEQKKKDDDDEKDAGLSERIMKFFRPNTDKPRERSGSGSSDSDNQDDDEQDDVCLHSNDIGNMSQLNQRVSDAMKLQKEVSKTMITQNEKHGTLNLAGSEEQK